MTAIDKYLPIWLDNMLKKSVDQAILFDHYHRERQFWYRHSAIGLLYFEYLYSQEVIVGYIEINGEEWENKQVQKHLQTHHGG